jgi:hypothetical protein
MPLDDVSTFLDEYNKASTVPGFDSQEFTKSFQRGANRNRVQPESQDSLKRKGFVRETAEALGGGATDAAELWMRAIRAVDPEGGNDTIRDFATFGINSIKNFVAKHPSLAPDNQVETGVKRWWVEGVRSLVPSLSTAIPGILGGAVAGPIGATAGGGAVSGAIFGLAEFDRFNEEVEERIDQLGLTEEEAVAMRQEARSPAIFSALTEGGLEAAANALQVRTLGKFLPGRKSLKNIARQPIKSLFTKTPGQALKDAGKTLAITTPVEVGTEFAQEAIETKFRRDVGLTDMDSMGAGMRALGPAFVANLLFFGAGRTANAAQRYSIRRNLEDAQANPNKRRKAIREIANTIRGMDDPGAAEIADKLEDSGRAFITSGLDIDINTDFGVQNTLGAYVEGLQKGELTVDITKKLEKKFQQDLDRENLTTQDRITAFQMASGLRGINKLFSAQEKKKTVKVPATEADKLEMIGKAATTSRPVEIKDTKEVEVEETAPEQLEDIAKEVSTPGKRAEELLRQALIKQGKTAEEAEAQLKAEEESFRKPKKKPTITKPEKLSDEEVAKEISDLRKTFPAQEPELQKIQQERIDELVEVQKQRKLGGVEAEEAVAKARKEEREAVAKPPTKKEILEKIPKRVKEFKAPGEVREKFKEPLKLKTTKEKKDILASLKKIQKEVIKGDTIEIEEVAPQAVVDKIRQQIDEDATAEEFQALIDSIEDAPVGKAVVAPIDAKTERQVRKELKDPEITAEERSDLEAILTDAGLPIKAPEKVAKPKKKKTVPIPEIAETKAGLAQVTELVKKTELKFISGQISDKQKAILRDEVLALRERRDFIQSKVGELPPSVEKARSNIKRKVARIKLGVDPTIIADLAVIGNFHFRNGATSFTEFTKRMVAEFGSGIRKFMREVFSIVSTNVKVEKALADFSIFEQEGLQEFTSSKTSRKQKAAGFKKLKDRGKLEAGTDNIDFGGGKFDIGSEFTDANNEVLDPFNRDKQHNLEIIESRKNDPSDSGTIFNVFNVIKEDENIVNLLRQANTLVKEDGEIHIQVFEGDKSGDGKITKDGFQRNQRLSEYLPLVKQVFSKDDISVKDGIITVQNVPEKVTNARRNIREKLGVTGRISLGVDPTVARDLGVVGTHHFKKGAKTFFAWAKKMIADFGNGVRSVLRRVFNTVKTEQQFEEQLAAIEEIEAAKPVQEKPAPGRPSIVPENIEVKFDANKVEIESIKTPNINKSPSNEQSLFGKIKTKAQEFWRPFSTLPDAKEVLFARSVGRGAIARTEAFMLKLKKRIDANPLEVRREIFRYLDGDIELEDLPQKVRGMAKSIRGASDRIGRGLVRRGLLPKEAFDTLKGKYVHYLYAKHIVGDDVEIQASRLLTPSGLLDMSYLKSRNPNLTAVDRRALGLIDDSGVAVPIGMGKALLDIAKFDYLQKLASPDLDLVWQPSVVKIGNQTWGISKLQAEVKSQQALVAASAKKGIIDSAETERLRVLENAFNAVKKKAGKEPSGFSQIPDSARYGNLAGAFVRTPIFDDIMPLVTPLSSNAGVGKLFQTLAGFNAQVTGLFKAGKVALNPPTMFRNSISNILQNNMRGRSLTAIPRDIKSAIQSMINKDEHFVTAKRMGLFESNWATGELNEVLRDINTINTSNWSQFLGFVAKMSRFYGKIDDVAKLAIYKQLRTSGELNKLGIGTGKKLDVGDAIVEAQKWGMDYSLSSRSIKHLRRQILPFGTYQYKIAPLILESLKKRPWVIGKYMAFLGIGGFSIAQELIKGYFDVDDDEWERLQKQLPHYIKQNQTFAPLPWKSPEGNWQWVNGEYFMPWGNWSTILKDLGGGEPYEAFKSVGFGSPILSVFQVLQSGARDKAPVDPFTKQPIYNLLDTPQDKFLKLSSWLSNQIMPSVFENIAVTDAARQGAIGTGVRAVASKVTGKPFKDKWGRTLTLDQALGRWFGFNITTISPRQSRAIKEFRIRELGIELSRKLKDPRITPKQRIKVRRKHREEVRKIRLGG